MSEHGNSGSGHYERLTRLDESFLIYESENSPMHVASTGIFEAGPLRTPEGGIDEDRIRAAVAARLHRIPRYRQRIARTPLRGDPVWVDDDRFNLLYHVRHSRLPSPGGERLLKRQAGRILSQPLDLHKPPWEMWVIEGLEGDRFALITKVHHSMVDGVSGADLLSLLMSSEPDAPEETPEPWEPRPLPPTWKLAVDEVGNAVSAPLQLAAGAWRLWRDEGSARHDLAERARAAGRLLEGGLRSASHTGLNRPIGPDRRVDWWSLEIDRLRAVKRSLGGTLNDVVLATTAGAVRRFLRETRCERVDDLDFRVMAPVSVRGSDERGVLGNRVSAWIVPLPISEPDPVRRLEAVCEATAELKESRAALGAQALTELSEWTGSALLSLGSRLMNLGQPFNMVVTNVPGPQVPLYLLGARMLDVHPMVPLLGTLSTGIALFSYAGRLSWGFSADWDLVPDLHDLVSATQRSFEELESAAASRAAA